MSRDIRDRTFADLKEGEDLKPLHITVTQEHIDGFQEFLGHFETEGYWSKSPGKNLHADEDYARQHIYGSVVGDANQTIQYLCQVVTDSLPWGSLLSGHSDLDIKLVNPTRLGDTVVVSGKIVEKRTEDGRNFAICEVIANKRGDKVVAIGTITAWVPC